MFLVECGDLNEKLVTICEELIKKILKKIEDYVFVEQALKVSSDVRTMTTKFQDKADSSKDLVDFEDYLEDIKNQQRQTILNQYYDLIEWLMMLY